MSIKNFNRRYFISKLAFFLIKFSLKNDGVLFISFHVIFIRILDSLNDFAISLVIRIRRPVGFPRDPTSYIDQTSIKTRDLLPCHKSQAKIFYNGLVYCSRSNKQKMNKYSGSRINLTLSQSTRKGSCLSSSLWLQGSRFMFQKDVSFTYTC